MSYGNSILERVKKKALVDNVDAKEAIISTCLTYEDLGKLLVDVAESMGDESFDDEVVELLAKAIELFI